MAREEQYREQSRSKQIPTMKPHPSYNESQRNIRPSMQKQLNGANVLSQKVSEKRKANAATDQYSSATILDTSVIGRESAYRSSYKNAGVRSFPNGHQQPQSLNQNNYMTNEPVSVNRSRIDQASFSQPPHLNMPRERESSVKTSQLNNTLISGGKLNPSSSVPPNGN